LFCVKQKQKFLKVYAITLFHHNYIYIYIYIYEFFVLESKSLPHNTPEDDDTLWNNLSPGLKEIIEIPDLIIDATEAKPYDPISEVPMEDQK
jgi:hypothetical protein